MFWKVMTTRPDICIGILELILGIRIRSVRASGQATLKITPDGKGVRLDVFADDQNGTMYDIEMQTTSQNCLPERMRYYQGMIDVNTLHNGEDYDSLPDSKVIFICLNDQFGHGRPMYRFRNLDIAHPELELHDRTEKIVLNASADWDDSNPDLSEFLQYVRTGLPDSQLSESIKGAVSDIRRDKESEEEYMDYYTEQMRNEYFRGRAEEKKNTEDTFARLSAVMQEHGCSANDFARAMSDTGFRKEIMQKYGIS